MRDDLSDEALPEVVDFQGAQEKVKVCDPVVEEEGDTGDKQIHGRVDYFMD